MMHRSWYWAIVVQLMLSTTALGSAANKACLYDNEMTKPMSHSEFWSIVDRTTNCGGDRYCQRDALRVELEVKSPVDLIRFERTHWDYMNRALTWDLHGAGYVIHGGMSEDGFFAFRNWLISAGSQVYEEALHEADSLADHMPLSDVDALEFEDFAYVAGELWIRKCESNLERFGDITKRSGLVYGSQPTGAPFEERDSIAMSKRYPKLWKRFAQRPLG